MSTRVCIHCENLVHVYPNGVEALKGINLDLCAEDYVALVGQNGSGKTTLAKHFNGLLKPTSGSVCVDGVATTDVRISALSRKIGYVFQNPDDMLFCSSIEEEIGFGLKMSGAPAGAVQTRVEAIIHELCLDDLRGEHPFALSLGDRQRLAVACALCLDPEIFIFDEPTTGQDYVGAESIMALIDHLHQSGKTIIIITHDMPIVAEHARRVVVMNAGQVVMDGSPGEVFADIAQLEHLSLKPPQVTLLASRLGYPAGEILTVPQMTAYLRHNVLQNASMRGKEAN